MNARTNMLVGFAALLSAGLLVTSPASAEDSAHRLDLDRRSRAEGLGTSAVELLERLPGRGAAAMTEQLIKRFSAAPEGVSMAGKSAMSEREGRVRVEGEGWSLMVEGDGTQVKYRNRAFRDARGAGASAAKRPAIKDLEERGRAFIKEHLAAEVELGEGEGLEVLRAAYEVRGIRGTEPGSLASESVSASTVVFTRTINGLDILGPGAKVAVHFTSDGQVYGFDYDWASYRAVGRRQPVLDIAGLKERERALSATPESAEVRTKRWECGYFDGGAAKRDPKALVQAACIAHKQVDTVGDAARNRVDPTDGMLSSGVIEAIPAGVEPEADERWIEVQKLRGAEVSSPVKAPGAAPAEGVQALKGMASGEAQADVGNGEAPAACSASPAGRGGKGGMVWAFALGAVALVARGLRRKA